MFDINGAEFIVLAVIVLVVVGPERLPAYAQQLGRMVRELRKFAMGARDQVRAELGPEFDDVDWSKLDPRQYDPRRIVREALSEVWEDPAPASNGSSALTPSGGSALKPPSARMASAAAVPLTKRPGSTASTRGGAAPFDVEAT